MATTAAPLIAIFDPVLREHEFIRQGNSWFRIGNDSTLVIKLQPSWPGPIVNLGMFYTQYGAVTRPKINECQVWTTLEAIAPDALRADRLLDPSTDIPDEVRRNELQQIILMHGLPWLDGIAKLDTARAFLARKTSRAVFIAPTARPELEGPQ